MHNKTKEQLLDELSEVQRILEEKKEIHGQMIRKLQTLIANSGLFSQIIDFFPYPIVIFTPDYEITMVNNAFITMTKARLNSKEKDSMRILQYKIEDTQLVSAIVQVFKGDTFFLEELKNPFSMFSVFKRQNGIRAGSFKRAIIFPVPADDNRITHGVIVFMP